MAPVTNAMAHGELVVCSIERWLALSRKAVA
jgi:hypothetical protein